MRTHLRRMPVVVLARVGRTWSLFRPLDMVEFNKGEGREPWVTRLGLVVYYPTLIAAIGGAVVMWQRRARRALWVLLVPAIAVTVGVARHLRADALPCRGRAVARDPRRGRRARGHRRASERRHQEPRRHGETAYRSICVAMSVSGRVVPALIPFHVSSPAGSTSRRGPGGRSRRTARRRPSRRTATRTRWPPRRRRRVVARTWGKRSSWMRDRSIA